MITQATVTATAGAAGTATANLPSFAAGITRRVSQVAVSSTSVAITTGDLFLNSLIMATTANANRDVASGDPPMDIRPQDNLSMKWSGSDVGATCVATFYYEDV